MAKLLVNIFLLVIAAAVVRGQTCSGANTVWSTCAPACKDYCTKDPSEVCILPCTDGCMCMSGYRYEAYDSDNCVPEDDCPTCPGNEIYKICGTACQDYCGKPEDDQACTRQCVQGCFCKEGYVRAYDSATAPCVPKTSCQTSG